MASEFPIQDNKIRIAGDETSFGECADSGPNQAQASEPEPAARRKGLWISRQLRLRAVVASWSYLDVFVANDFSRFEYDHAVRPSNRRKAVGQQDNG